MRLPGLSGRLLVLLPLLMLALLLRVLRLDFQPLWWDEGYSVWFAAHPVGQMAALTAGDIHPPLYYALLHGWTLLLGLGPVSLRLFSVAAGILALPAIYVAGRRALGRRGAWLAALLLAINPLHIYYSQEVRMYGLVALFSAAILAVAWPTLQKEQPRPRDLVPYVLLTAASLYTEYYAVFLPLGLTLYALWRWRHAPRALAVWLAGQIACALFFLPWLLYATPKLVPYVSQKVVLDADRPLSFVPYMARHLSAFIAGHLEGPLTPWWPAALALLGIGIVALVLEIRDWRLEIRNSLISNLQSPILLATVVVTALGLGYAISLRFPFFPPRGERLLLLALPPFLLLGAAAIDALWRRSRVGGLLAAGLAGAVAAVSLLGFYTVPRYPGDDYRPLLARAVEQGRPGDTLFAVYPWQAGYWFSYGDPAGPQAVLAPSPEWGPGVSAALDSALAAGHVWFPAHLALGGQLETAVERYLATRARPFAVEWYGPGTRLSAWSIEPAMPDQVLALPPLRFILPDRIAGSQTMTAREAGNPTPPGEMILAGVAAGPGPVPAANAVASLTLRWDAASAPPELSVSVRLVDALGQTWARNDYAPPGSAAPSGGQPPASPLPRAAQAGWSAEDRIGLLVPAGTPPGAYRVEVSLRPKDGDRPLEAIAADGARATSAALFGLSIAPADLPLGPERLPIAEKQPVALDDGLRFLGYSGSGEPLVPGQAHKISLFWQATSHPSADYLAFVQLLDGHGVLKANWQAAPGASFPAGQWPTGTLMHTQVALQPPADLPDGQYTLIAGLFRPAGAARLRTAAGADHLTLGQVTVAGRRHDMAAPHPAFPLDARFGALARLVGYELPGQGTGPLVPGGKLSLVLYWQAQAASEQPYAVFVHLLDAEGRQRGGGDSEPGAGAYPTTGWVKGEFLADRHEIVVDPDAMPGSYSIAIGFYNPVTGERLAGPSGAGGFVLDSTVTVSAP